MNSNHRDEQIDSFIKNDIIDLIRLKVAEKSARKTAKMIALEAIIKKMEDNVTEDFLSYPELLKTYEILERADMYEDETIMGHTIGKYLESAPVIQTNVNSNMPTLSGNINNLTISESKREEIPKKEISMIKDIISKARLSPNSQEDSIIDATITQIEK